MVFASLATVGEASMLLETLAIRLGLLQDPGFSSWSLGFSKSVLPHQANIVPGSEDVGLDILEVHYFILPSTL